MSTSDAVTSDRSLEALRQGLHKLGYSEGENILFEYRGAEGKPDRIPGFVAELIRLKVDVIFCPNLPAIDAAKQATRTLPIVMISNVDPFELGIVDSFARPGGNITGLTLQSLELSRQRLELLKENFSQAFSCRTCLESRRREHESDNQTDPSGRATAGCNAPSGWGARSF